jgi:3-deoxy-manno-octulosonate cytidylyltransferase (CMP-KDO synthetase)
MKSIAIIPARMGASRFPGKPMATILGMPMIGHCYYRTKIAEGIDGTYVATCDQEIFDYIEGIGGKAVMTSTKHNRATDRTAEAMMKIEEETGEVVDVVVMVQGDEPLILPENISNTLPPFTDPSIDITNIMSRLRTYEHFVDQNNVKVVTNQKKDALYFSREAIPSPWRGWEQLPMYMQVGVIAFRRQVLLDFNTAPELELEIIESVDMNRVLEMGGKIRMVPTESFNIGVDTPEELKEVAELMKNDPIYKNYGSL